MSERDWKPEVDLVSHRTFDPERKSAVVRWYGDLEYFLGCRRKNLQLRVVRSRRGRWWEVVLVLEPMFEQHDDAVDCADDIQANLPYLLKTFPHGYHSWSFYMDEREEPEPIVTSLAQRDTKSRQRTRRPIPLKTRFLVLERDGFRCRYCGRGTDEVKLHVDHVRPRSKGGPDDEVNLVAACQDCNLGKGTLELTA